MAGLYLNEMVWICETAGAGCLILKGRRWWRWGGGVEWKQGKGERERYAAVEGVEKGKTRRN